MKVNNILGFEKHLGALRKVRFLYFLLVFIFGQSLTVQAQNDPKAEVSMKVRSCATAKIMM
jgi:hypothetical protein